MAAFQQGTENIGNGVSTVSVVYPTAFSSTPEVVIAVVQNTVDVGPTALFAEVTASSTTGFTVKISGATGTANYVLAWVAGSATLMFDVVAQLGFRVSQLTERTTAPLSADYFPMVSTSPVLRTMLIKWGTVYGMFGQRVSAPATPAASGSLGQWAVDSNWYYSHDGAVWGRSPRQTTAWDWTAQQAATWVQEGQESLVEDQQTVAVTFAKEFGSTPLVTFSIQNTTAGDKLVLYGVLTAVSSTGFTVTLSSPPDSGDYDLNWRATDDNVP